MSGLKALRWSSPANATTASCGVVTMSKTDRAYLDAMNQNLKLFSKEDSLFALMGAFAQVWHPLSRHQIAQKIFAAVNDDPSSLLALKVMVEMPKCTRSLRVARDDKDLVEAYNQAAETIVHGIAKYRSAKAANIFDSFIGPLFDQKSDVLPAVLENWGLACLEGCGAAHQNKALAEDILPAQYSWINRLTLVNCSLGAYLRPTDHRDDLRL